MNNISYLCLIFSLLIFANSCRSIGVLEKKGIEFVEGSDLLYEVNAEGEKYSFDLNINQFSTNYISFDWDMDGTRSGTVSMTQKPLETATKLMNYFTGGYSELKDETSVWISQQLFKDLKTGKTVEINLGKGNVKKFRNNGYEGYCFKDKDGKEICINTLVVWDEDMKQEIWIADDPNNRLIVKMDIGFEINLIEIQ